MERSFNFQKFATYPYSFNGNSNAEIVAYLKRKGIYRLYHFTDRRNLDSILKEGLFSWSYLDRNSKFYVSGGDNWSHQADELRGLQNYVRLSFCDDHPMAWRLHNDGHRLVLIEIDVNVLLNSSVKFSDMNATKSYSSIGQGLDFVRNNINLSATQQHYVSRNSPLFDAHQSEVLIDTHISQRYILDWNHISF